MSTSSVTGPIAFDSLTVNGPLTANGPVTTSDSVTANGPVITNDTTTANGPVVTNSTTTANGPVSILPTSDAGVVTFSIKPGTQSLDELADASGVADILQNQQPLFHVSSACATGQTPGYTYQSCPSFGYLSRLDTSTAEYGTRISPRLAQYIILDGPYNGCTVTLPPPTYYDSPIGTHVYIYNGTNNVVNGGPDGADSVAYLAGGEMPPNSILHVVYIINRWYTVSMANLFNQNCLATCNTIVTPDLTGSGTITLPIAGAITLLGYFGGSDLVLPTYSLGYREFTCKIHNALGYDLHAPNSLATLAGGTFADGSLLVATWMGNRWLRG